MTLHATQTDAGLDDDALERLVAAVDGDIQAGVYDGAVLMVGRHGEPALHTAVGWADRDGGRATRTDDVFRVLSLTKAFTNALILRAISRGELSTATRIVEVLPEFLGTDRFRGARKDRITVGHLLTHRAGMPATPTPVPYAQLGQLDLTIAAICELEPIADAGSAVNYSPCINHALLGRILQRLDGDRVALREVMRRDLFEPLGMTSTALGAPAAWGERLVPLKARFTAAGWLTEHDVEVLNDVISEDAEMPWVGAVTTAEDIFRFAEMLRRGGELDGVRIIAPAVLDVASTNQTGDVRNDLYARLAVANGWETLPAFIGLGFMLAGEGLAPNMFGTFPSPRTFGNYGAGSTLFWVDPERDLTFVCLTAGVLAHPPNIQRFHRLSDMTAAAAL
jgi:CubicO group peptidase (beta-lactamase class C family)